ncbi:50S ribosomal protein L29 [Hippea alviniae]|uniref:50S ribosomal protein L29 n=1 Tax=Hippea alviniae TaxID=1279027 RepID=UPI0003B65A2A|nr:50S ribosomal protein L29 [Hippea alviniae]
MKASELRQKSLKELIEEERKLREEIFKLNMRKGLEQMENPHKIRNLRKDLARVLTVKNEKLKKGEQV